MFIFYSLPTSNFCNNGKNNETFQSILPDLEFLDSGEVVLHCPPAKPTRPLPTHPYIILNVTHNQG